MDSNQMGLPVEVWQRIFELATQYDEGEFRHESKEFGRSTYGPFEHYRFKNAQNVVEPNKSFCTKLGLLHVCRSWHSMAQRFTYEVIYVGNHSASLVAALKRSAKMNNGQGYGKFVRRIVLVSGSRRAANKSTFLKVIKACPNATMLLKYDHDHTIIPPSLPPLPALLRYDWSCEENIPSDYPPHPSDIYTLRDIIRKTPNLEYLSISLGRDYRFSQKIMLEHEPISTNITTLRLCHRDLCSSVTEELSRWLFPNLKHLIADPDILTATIQPYFNSQIEVIEFTERLHWPTPDTSPLFNTCPNLREMYFHLNSYIMMFAGPISRPTKIKKIGIYRGEWERQHYFGMDDHYGLSRRFEQITKEAFPHLQAVVLYGNWASVLTAPYWLRITERLNQHGVSLEYPDGRLVDDTNPLRLQSEPQPLPQVL